MKNETTYEKAKKRVNIKIGFYIHLAVYVVVNIVLIIINFSTSPAYLWFVWPLLGWGIGVVFHALGIFVFSETSLVKERMIEKEMKTEASKKQ